MVWNMGWVLVDLTSTVSPCVTVIGSKVGAQLRLMPAATQHSLGHPNGLGDGQGSELFQLESNTSCARLLGTRVCLFMLPLWWRMQPQKLFLEISPHAEWFWLHWRQSRKLGRDWVLVASTSFCAQIHPEAWPASELPTWVNTFPCI